MKNSNRIFFVQSAALVFCAFLFVQVQAPLFAQSGPIQIQSAPANQPIPVRSNGELDSLIAPIALYPDPLLSQVLVASTYPLEIVQASQWLKQNSNLSGAALQDAARQQDWDASVQALMLFPDVLHQLSDNIQWTTDLGNAFIAQETGVMDAVQRLRSQAMTSGNLTSNAQQTVTRQVEGPATVVEIVPSNPQVIYVPTYDPYAVWDSSYFYSYPVLRPFRTSFFVGSSRIYWPTGIFVGSYFSGWNGWNGWGWQPNWFGRRIVVNNTFFNRYGYGNGYGYNRSGVAAVNRPSGLTVWRHEPSRQTPFGYTNRSVPTQRYDDSRRAPINRVPQAAVRPPNTAPAATPAPNVSRPRGGAAYRSNRPAPVQGAPSVAPNNFNRGGNGIRGGVRSSSPPVQNFRGPSMNVPQQRGAEHFRSETPRAQSSGASRSAARGNGNHRGR